MEPFLNLITICLAQVLESRERGPGIGGVPPKAQKERGGLQLAD